MPVLAISDEGPSGAQKSDEPEKRSGCRYWHPQTKKHPARKNRPNPTPALLPNTFHYGTGDRLRSLPRHLSPLLQARQNCVHGQGFCGIFDFIQPPAKDATWTATTNSPLKPESGKNSCRPKRPSPPSRSEPVPWLPMPPSADSPGWKPSTAKA